MTKITSFNLNGIRAAHKKGFVDWLKESSPDVLCMQEVRATEEQIPSDILDQGYHAYWHLAEKKGYSGVGLLTKEEPISVETGIGVDWITSEGRVIRAEFENFRVFSIYFPSGSSGDHRQDLKITFLNEFLPYVKQFVGDSKPTILCGDYNICHQAIDVHDPVRNATVSGFLPEEREWMTDLIESGWIDAFRAMHPEKPDLYSWWSYRARAKTNNKGWRIDYQMVSPSLEPLINEAEIEREVNLSDHAPVSITYGF
jgi:exodeoxyribonuclease-3